MTQKRAGSVSSNVYGHLILAGRDGATPEQIADALGKSRWRVRSFLSCLVTEGLAEHIGRYTWRAIMPINPVYCS